MNYYCDNGAFHNYYCCKTCWNRHPKAKEFEDKSFSKGFRNYVNKEAWRSEVNEARKNGFTKKQAEYLCRGMKATFQQIVLHEKNEDGSYRAT